MLPEQPLNLTIATNVTDSVLLQQDILDQVECCFKELYDYQISLGIFDQDCRILKLFNHDNELTFDEANDWCKQLIDNIAAKPPVKHKILFMMKEKEHHTKLPHSIMCYTNPVCSEANVIGTLALFLPTDYDNIFMDSLLNAVTKIVESIIKVGKYKDELNSKISWEKAIVDTISEGLFSIDRSGVITYMNDLGASILCLKKDEIIGEKLIDVIGFRPELLDILETGEGWINRELCFKSIKKGPVRLIKNAAPIKDNNGNIIGVLDTFREIKRVHSLVNQITGASARFIFEDIIYKSQEMQNSIEMARVVAASQGPVLLLGESGTGKELFAHSIHSASDRSEGPFIIVDCAALPHELIESELFGYVEGSFTGALRKGNVGKFELANGGTIFLDEIGELPLESQAKLLRVLQTHNITRIGDKKTLSVDFKVIAATNKNLEYEVSQHNFRKDLFYRINLFSIHIPPLRKRKEDILLLANYFANKTNIKLYNRDVKIENKVLSALLIYDWPGNVRELENVMQRAVYLSKGDFIRLEHLPEKLINNSVAKQNTIVDLCANTVLSDREKEQWYIMNVLNSCKGNKSKAAYALGISRPTLYKRMKELHILNDDSTLRSFQ